MDPTLEEGKVVYQENQNDQADEEEEKKEEGDEEEQWDDVEEEEGELTKQSHHIPQADGITQLDVQRHYERCCREAASIVVCNYAALNLAISMGFAGRKQIASDAANDRFSARKGQVNLLKQYIGGAMLDANPADVTIRITLINIIVELLMQEDIDENDLEDCLDDWMEENFSVLADENSHKEIGKKLIKVRKQLTYCAIN